MPAILEFGQSFPYYPHSFTVAHYLRRRQILNALPTFCRLDLPRYDYSDNSVLDSIIDHDVEVSAWL